MKNHLDEFARGWKVLIAAFFGNALGYGVLAVNSLGILGPRLGKEFGWGAGLVNSGFLILSLVGLIGLPLAGILCDRIGPRRVALGSSLMVMPCYMGFALLDNSVTLYFVAWSLLALLGAGALPISWSRAVNNHFQIHKGLALGISLLGTGLTGSLLKPFLFWLVEHWGWRGGFIGLGCLPLLSFTIALFFFFDKTREALPDKSPGPLRPDPAMLGLTLGQALRSWQLWTLLGAVALAAIGVSGALTNMETILKTKGLMLSDIRSLVPITGLAMIAGRLGSSYLVDKLWAPIVACFFLTLAAIAFGLLSLTTPSFLGAIGIIIVIGLAIGMELDMAAFLVARYFGPRNYASIYALVYGSFTAFTGVVAVFYGLALDRFGNFNLVLGCSSVVLVLSGLLFVRLGPYVYPIGLMDSADVA